MTCGPNRTCYAACPCREAAQAERIARLEEALREIHGKTSHHSIRYGASPMALVDACAEIARAALAAKGEDRG